MASPQGKTEETASETTPAVPVRTDSPPGPGRSAPLAQAWIPLLLAAVAFLVYLPSLKSDFVYDARVEMLQEGFITSLFNLPDVLTLKVLHMNLMLSDRPGQILYLMLIAAVCGQTPFGYHLCSNLLHAATVALLFIVLRRLLEREGASRDGLKTALAAAVSLLFAVHPLNVESVAEVSYSSSILVAFFTLLALLAATAFRAEDRHSVRTMGICGALCCLAAVMCKESGAAAAVVLVAYWWLFRRGEEKKPWLIFLGAGLALTAAFLAARFLLSTLVMGAANHGKVSLVAFILVQSRLWVMMMAKTVWPLHLSADYSPSNIHGMSNSVTMMIFILVLYGQAWLGSRSRIGALGVAIYWLGLATVSNLVPLFHAEADRYYYLPLVGAAMQLLALVLLLDPPVLRRAAVAVCFCALLPLAILAIARQAVFADDFSLWTATVQASPDSVRAHNGLGAMYLDRGQLDKAFPELQVAEKINPADDQVHNNLGVLLLKKGHAKEAVTEFQKAVALFPNSPKTAYNLGLALVQVGRTNEAVVQFARAVEMNPRFDDAYNDLGFALEREGRLNDAIALFQQALKINPENELAQKNLINAQAVRENRLSP